MKVFAMEIFAVGGKWAVRANRWADGGTNLQHPTQSNCNDLVEQSTRLLRPGCRAGYLQPFTTARTNQRSRSAVPGTEPVQQLAQLFRTVYLGHPRCQPSRVTQSLHSHCQSND